MGKDVVEKRLEEYEDVFADIFDNLFLGGKGIVQADNLVSMPTMAYTRQADGSLRGGIRDIRKESCLGGRYRLVCGIENQTDVDHTMPVRVMGYEYADYEAQIKKIMDENMQNGKSAGAKRIYNNQKLGPVMTGILYYGDRKWKKPRCLHDMLEFPEGLDEVLKPYVADYPIHVVEAARLTKAERERLTSDFRLVAEYLACRREEGKWRKFVADGKYCIRHIEELLDVLGEISRDERYYVLLNKIREENREKEEWHMCNIAEELERIGMEKGLEEGIEKGIEQGLERGIRSMILDNLNLGTGKEQILEKVVYYFSVSLEKAEAYYNRAAAK